MLREQFKPTKIKLGVMGDVVPHLRWQVIARFDWSGHFPGSVWAAPQRKLNAQELGQLALQCAQFDQLLAEKPAS